MKNQHSPSLVEPDDLPDEVDQEEPEIDFGQVKKKSVSGAVSYFLRTILLQSVGFFSVVALSTFFQPADFAIYGIVAALIGLLAFFSDVGLAAALVQKKTEPTKDDLQTAFVAQQVLSWLIVLIGLIIIYFGFLEKKTGPVGNWVLLASILSFPLVTLKTMPSILLERKLEFSKLVVPQILEQLVYHGILITLAWMGYGAIAFACAIISRTIIGVVAMTIIQPWPFGFRFNFKSFKALFSYGFKFQLNDLLARVKDQLFYLFLGGWLPLNQFGYIQWAKQWSMYPYNLTVQNVMAITFPTFSRLQHHKDKLARAIELSLFFISLAIFPILVGMSLFIYPLTQVLPAYNKWEPAVLSFVFFTLSIGWAALSTPLTNTLNAIGKINKTLKLMIMWTSLTWLITPLFVLKLGYNGVALAALVIGFSSLLVFYYVKQEVEVHIWDQIWRQLFASFAMAVVGFLGWHYWLRGIPEMVAGIILVGLTYFVVMGVVGWKKVLGEVKSLKS